jgi:hypothetical protein
MTAVLEEIMGIDGDNSSLIRLRNVSEDDIHHAYKHPVLVRMSRVLDDRNNIGSLLGDVDEITTGSVRELDGVDEPLRSDDVGDVRDRGATGSAEVEHLGARLDVDLVDTAENGRTELRAERVPHTVLDLLAVLAVDRDLLLVVDSVAWHEIAGQEEIVVFTASYEDAFVAMWLDDHFFGTSSASCTTSATSSESAAASGSSTTTAATT